MSTPPNAPLIDRPDSASRRRRTAYGMITAIAWALYVYLWLPLVTLLAWVLGARTGYAQLYLAQERIDPFVILSLPLIALVCGAVLVAWAEYNRARFADADARRRAPAVAANDVADALGATRDLLPRLRDARVVVLELDDAARPLAARVER